MSNDIHKSIMTMILLAGLILAVMLFVAVKKADPHYSLDKPSYNALNNIGYPPNEYYRYHSK